MHFALASQKFEKSKIRIGSILISIISTCKNRCILHNFIEYLKDYAKEMSQKI